MKLPKIRGGKLKKKLYRCNLKLKCALCIMRVLFNFNIFTPRTTIFNAYCMLFFPHFRCTLYTHGSGCVKFNQFQKPDKWNTVNCELRTVNCGKEKKNEKKHKRKHEIYQIHNQNRVKQDRGTKKREEERKKNVIYPPFSCCMFTFNLSRLYVLLFFPGFMFIQYDDDDDNDDVYVLFSFPIQFLYYFDPLHTSRHVILPFAIRCFAYYIIISALCVFSAVSELVTLCGWCVLLSTLLINC